MNQAWKLFANIQFLLLSDLLLTWFERTFYRINFKIFYNLVILYWVLKFIRKKIEAVNYVLWPNAYVIVVILLHHQIQFMMIIGNHRRRCHHVFLTLKAETIKANWVCVIAEIIKYEIIAGRLYSYFYCLSVSLSAWHCRKSKTCSLPNRTRTSDRRLQKPIHYHYTIVYSAQGDKIII